MTPAATAYVKALVVSSADNPTVLSASCGNLTPPSRVHSGILLEVAADTGEANGGSNDMPVTVAMAPDDLIKACLLSRSRSLHVLSGWDSVRDDVVKAADIGVEAAAETSAARRRRR